MTDVEEWIARNLLNAPELQPWQKAQVARLLTIGPDNGEE